MGQQAINNERITNEKHKNNEKVPKRKTRYKMIRRTFIPVSY